MFMRFRVLAGTRFEFLAYSSFMAYLPALLNALNLEIGDDQLPKRSIFDSLLRKFRSTWFTSFLKKMRMWNVVFFFPMFGLNHSGDLPGQKAAEEPICRGCPDQKSHGSEEAGVSFGDGILIFPIPYPGNHRK